MLKIRDAQGTGDLSASILPSGLKTAYLDTEQILVLHK